MKKIQYILVLYFLVACYNPTFALSVQIDSDSITGGCNIQENNDGNSTGNDTEFPTRRRNISYSIDEYVPTSVEIDERCMVGEIPLSSGITPTGAKTYQVQLEVAPGMHGFQPNLSLSYNSMQTYSPIGVGWRLEGIPQIYRSGKNIYYHRKTEGIRMDNSDTFVLDGMTLIKIEDKSSIGYIIYESEQGNVKVKGCVSGEIMKYFEVYYPDGNKGVFGNINASENDIYYPITSLTDLHGNKITYEYLYTGNDYYISRILYNGASVEFSYITDTFSPATYSAGRKIDHTKLLNRITCKNESTTLGYYTLYQRSYTGIPQLWQIDYSRGGIQLNPLRFYYGDGENFGSYSSHSTILYNYFPYDQPATIRAIRGKFDNINKSDGVISMLHRYPYYKYHKDGGLFSHTTNTFKYGYGDNEDIFLYTDIGNSFVNPEPKFTTGLGFVDILCADIEGKQEERIIKINNIVSNNTDKIDFHIYRYTLTGALTEYLTRSFSFNTVYTDNSKNQSILPKFYYSGDFNGDGKMEILAVSVDNPFGETDRPSKCYLFDLESGKKLYESHVFNFKAEFPDLSTQYPIGTKFSQDLIYIIDYDGDGKSDICRIDKDGMYIYTFTTTNGGMSCNLIYSGTDLNLSKLDKKDLLSGDLNGDGLTDLALSPERTMYSPSQWDIFYSMGNGQFNKEICNGAGVNGSLATRFYLLDINGDGKSDLIRCDKLNIETYLMTDQGFLKKGTIENPSESLILIPVANTSRNTFPSILLLNDSKLIEYSYSRNNIKDNLLTGAVNSYGVIERNDYGFINQKGIESELYIPGSDAIYPYVNISESIPVIAFSETYLNNEFLNECEYHYTNAVVHRHGLGFCGFEKIRINDALNGTTIREYEPYKFGMQKSEITPTSKITFTNRANILSNQIYQLLVDRKEELDLLTEFKTTTTWNYNQYGYPDQEYAVSSDDITSKTLKEYINYDDIFNSERGYIIGFPISEETIITRNGSDTYTEKEYISSFSRGLPLSKITYKDGNQIVSETYEYDFNANMTAKKVNEYDSHITNTTSYVYDSYGRLIKETDPMGLSSQYSYNAQGLISASIDCRGNKTRLTYDPFGREVQTVNQDGTGRTLDYSWGSTDNEGIYSIVERFDGKPTVRKYFDAFNREVRSEESRFDYISLKKDKNYDCKGNLIAESLPYKSDYPSLWIYYDYDSYNRLTCRVEPTGKQINYDYSGSSVTEDDGRRQKIKEYNSAGELVSISDSEGTVYFELDADGQKRSVIIDDGNGSNNLSTTYTYDKYRRLISVVDPSQGETITAYDNAGNISSQTDANGNTTEFEYDSFGRLIKKTFPEFTTTYTYNDYNELISQNSTNGTYKTFIFDDLGRLCSEKDAGGDSWLQKDYTYKNGNVASIVYSSKYGTLTTEYYTYTNGHLTEVKIADGQSIYKLEEENEFGKPTLAVTGDITREYVYDEFGFPRFRGATTQSLLYQKEEYDFDWDTSNLISRWESRTGHGEAFDYDNQNRLTCYNGEYINYDSKGNINEKSDIGSYLYENEDKPYAVTGIVPYSDLDQPLTKEQNIEYTSFARPASISENGYDAKFQYNADGERVKMTISGNFITDRLERTYLGGCYEYEDNGVSANDFLEKLYLMGDYYSAPSVLFVVPKLELSEFDTVPGIRGDSIIWGIIDPDPIQPINPLGLDSEVIRPFGYFTCGKAHVSGVHQILRDYLGSITHFIRPDGTVAESYSYDAWGRVRLPEDGDRYLTTADGPMYLGRGYTGHEHLPLYGLINMNARLYDPLLGRFLSPDPYVQDVECLQNYNRYSYVRNNPFYYIDENGEKGWITVGFALAGGVSNVISNWKTIKEKGFWVGFGYFGVGALAAIADLYSGNLIKCFLPKNMQYFMNTGMIGGFAYAFTGGFAGGFTIGFGNSLLQGKNLKQSLKVGVEVGGLSGVLSGVVGALDGGYKAYKSGRNVLTGKNSTENLVNRAADKAQSSINTQGHVGGTEKHEYARNLLERRQTMYDKRRGLIFERNFTENGKTIRPDVVDFRNYKIYDYKFGYPNKNSLQLNQSLQMRSYRELMEQMFYHEFESVIIHRW